MLLGKPKRYAAKAPVKSDARRRQEGSGEEARARRAKKAGSGQKAAAKKDPAKKAAKKNKSARP